MKNTISTTRVGRTAAASVLLFAAAGSSVSAVEPSSSVPVTTAATTLSEARKGFKTRIALPKQTANAMPAPPRSLFAKVQYTSPVGALGAYLTPDPKDGAKHPAIIWITGGDSNSLDEVWSEHLRSNDQSAAAYRKAGIVMMFPSLRGGNDNPGNREALFGEVDDILAAADYLAREAYVDPRRIYLGGHSTGGTLVLLTAEVSPRFRCVFSFGPVGTISLYGQNLFPVDFARYDGNETLLRSPARWLSGIRGRVFVIEGASVQSNIAELNAMRYQQAANPLVSLLSVDGASHFSVLAPANELIAEKILKDRGPTAAIELNEGELAARMRR